LGETGGKKKIKRSTPFLPVSQVISGVQ